MLAANAAACPFMFQLWQAGARRRGDGRGVMSDCIFIGSSARETVLGRVMIANSNGCLPSDGQRSPEGGNSVAETAAQIEEAI